MSRLHRTPLAVALLVAAVLAGCGTATDPDPAATASEEPSTPTPTAASTPSPTPTPAPTLEQVTYGRTPADDRYFEEALNEGLEIANAYSDASFALDRDFDVVADAVVAACGDLERMGYNGAWMKLEQDASSTPGVLAVIAHTGPLAYCPEHMDALVDAAAGRWTGTTPGGVEIDLGHAEIAEMYPPWPAAPAGVEWLPAGWQEAGLTEWDEQVAYVLRPEDYDCGWGASACSGVTVLVRDACPGGVYVELGFLTGGAVTDRGNEITAALYPWDQAFVGIDAYGAGGDTVRVSDISCMG